MVSIICKSVDATSSVAIASNVVDGDITVGNNALRSGDIIIGHASASGDVAVLGGTGTVTLSGSNFVSGTFTTAPAFDFASGSLTYTAQNGYFTRVGSVVHYFIEVAWSSASGLPVQAVKIVNLEYTTRNINFPCAVGVMSSGVTLTSGDYLERALMRNNTANCEIYEEQSTGGALTTLKYSQFNTSGYILVQGTVPL